MRIGVIGAGQLGRMLALAGHPLGMNFCFLDPAEAPTAAALGAHLRGAFDDPAMLRQLAERSDFLTFEFENVPATALAAMPPNPAITPPAAALQVAQDRLLEKQLFAELDIATGPSRAIDSLESLQGAVAELGLPAVLKTRRLGYDGKGQQVLRDTADIEPAWQALGGRPLLLEQFVPFDFEVSLVAVRGQDGATAFYPLARNRHVDGILHSSIAPYLDVGLEAQAQRALRQLLEHFDYVGVLTVEFFAVGGTLLANEMAPRVHNSGHWTIEGAVTSQFENHLRAVAGLPLGSTEATGHSAMLNFIGAMPEARAVLGLEHCHLHDYCKAPRAGRKLGHATAVCRSAEARDIALAELEQLLP